MPTESFMKGYPPGLAIGAGNPEAQKYGRLWAEVPAYRAVSPGEQLAQVFLAQARPRRGADVIDFGCGTGRGALALATLGGLRVSMIDFVRNSLDPHVQEALAAEPEQFRFLKHDLEQPLPFAAPYGYCCDVMEHIPEARVGRVLENILLAAEHVFFSISTVDDVCGAAIGERLHMTVHPYSWWLGQLNRYDCVVHWSQDLGETCLFYVSAWQRGQAVVDAGVLNIEEQKVRENVRHNTAQGWTQVVPCETNDMEVILLGGGPSMPAFEDQIKRQLAEGAGDPAHGVKLVTLNGAYNWALEHGLHPAAQIIVDARPFNARFTKPVIEHCRYLIASQCDPSVFEGLPVEVTPTSGTFVWHTSTEMIRDILVEAYATEHWRVGSDVEGDWLLDERGVPKIFATEAEAEAMIANARSYGAISNHAKAIKLGRSDADWWYGIPGGSTVLLRAIPLLRMLGFRRFHLYGCDSCLSGDAHHAYAQPENDSPAVVPVTCGDRVFACAPWMAAQATEFIDLIRFLGDEIEIEVYGDGLLAHILATGASLADAQEGVAP